ncbi:hypothetical protein L6Q21_09815 [Sandaracinobacter sp. RS1-74]|uniref:hypothetical protein n=1 Tax=Sandaracinobacteroides sayramensis TaxID=2913411 RepID=UPI001EDC7AAE|nr:hypothetical protein [Sandaracinobacteroides sayramensis]MCG2841276.1 hypothetical protein [Sandaracinobacteroides sayramensis]
MHTTTSRSPTQHCYGVIVDRRASWWLVEFHATETRPIAAHRLTGKLTRAMTDYLRQDAGSDDAFTEVASLNPESCCWSGEFAFVPSRQSPDRFDIDAHPWGSDADEQETRLAEVMIDSTLFPLPAGFVSVLQTLPPEDLPVLAIRPSDYRCATFEVLTARYMPTYRPLSPWRDLSNDAVTDGGCNIVGWKPAQDWIKPA